MIFEYSYFTCISNKLDCFVPRNDNIILFFSCILQDILSLSQYLLHFFPFCKFIHELVEIADFAHESVWHLFNTIATDNTSDEVTIWIKFWRLTEEGLEINSLGEYVFESLHIISCEPGNNLVNFRFGSSFLFYFCHEEWIDTREWHGEDFGIMHALVVTHFDAKSSGRESLHVHDIHIIIHKFWIFFSLFFPVSHDFFVDLIAMFLRCIFDIGKPYRFIVFEIHQLWKRT